MRTIEEFKQGLIDELGSENEDLIRAVVNETIDFAQRWIPVEEELPPVGELVQIRLKYMTFEGNMSEDYSYDHDKVIVKDDNKMFDCEQCSVKVTHWRPINLK